MSTRRQFAVNAASGFAAQATVVGVGIVLMPYAMSKLGPEAYGVFQLAQSALNFFVLLQLGMGPTLVRFYAQSLSSKDTDQVAAITSTAQAILGLLGLVGTAAMLGLIPLFLRFYDVAPEMWFSASILLVCMAVSLFLNMVFIVPQGIVLGSNRYDWANGTEIACHLTRLALIVTAFTLWGPSILLLGVCILFSQILRFASLWILAIRCVGRAAFFSIRSFERNAVRSMASFSSLNVTNAVAYYLVLQGPLLIIGKVLGKEAVTLFAPAILVGVSMQGFLGRMTRPLVPLASQAFVNNDRARLGRLSMLTARVSACAGLGMALAICVFGEQLVGLWLGDEMAWTWSLIAVLALGTVVSQTAGANYCLALGGGNLWPTVKSQVVLGIAASSGVAVGTIWFAWSLTHVAIYIMACQCVRNVLYLTCAYSGQFAYRTWPYILYVYIQPLLVFFVVVVAGHVLQRALPPTSLPLLGAEIAAVLLLYALLAWAVILPKEVTSVVWRRLPLQQTKTSTRG